MMYAKDLRAQARAALRGKWGVAIAVGLVASLLGGTGSVSTVSTSASGSTDGWLNFISHDVWIVVLTAVVVSGLLALVIGGVMQLGLCDFNTRLVKGQEVRFGLLFGQFHRLWTGFCMNIVVSFFIFLWSLLLVIPGIIAAYRYAMVPYLMAEFPDLGVMDAMDESKRLMAGNKWRLFCLQLSFIGWELLAAVTCGIGGLWVTPYVQAATAAFYLEVTGRNSWNQVQG